MVYLWKKNGRVFHHADKEAAAQLDGLTGAPDMEVPDEEFAAAGGLVRISGGKIVLGKTEEDVAEEAKAARLAFLKQKLADSDYIAVKIAEGTATKGDYAAKIAERQKWREEISSLSA